MTSDQGRQKKKEVMALNTSMLEETECRHIDLKMPTFDVPTLVCVFFSFLFIWLIMPSGDSSSPLFLFSFSHNSDIYLLYLNYNTTVHFHIIHHHVSPHRARKDSTVGLCIFCHVVIFHANILPSSAKSLFFVSFLCWCLHLCTISFHTLVIISLLTFIHIWMYFVLLLSLLIRAVCCPCSFCFYPCKWKISTADTWSMPTQTLS